MSITIIAKTLALSKPNKVYNDKLYPNVLNALLNNAVNGLKELADVKDDKSSDIYYPLQFDIFQYDFGDSIKSLYDEDFSAADIVARHNMCVAALMNEMRLCFKSLFCNFISVINDGGNCKNCLGFNTHPEYADRLLQFFDVSMQDDSILMKKGFVLLDVLNNDSKTIKTLSSKHILKLMIDTLALSSSFIKETAFSDTSTINSIIRYYEEKIDKNLKFLSKRILDYYLPLSYPGIYISSDDELFVDSYALGEDKDSLYLIDQETKELEEFDRSEFKFRTN